MPGCGVEAIQALEGAAWASPELRTLYATRGIPGFPWHTVSTPAPESTHGDATVTAAADTLAVVRRHVIPYDYAFTVFVKGRWVGRRLLEVYAEELPHHSLAYYEACMRTGRLYSIQRGALGGHNTQRRLLKRAAVQEKGQYSSAAHGVADAADAWADLNVVLQQGDVVYHIVHRHEIPVTVGATGVDPVHITAVCIARYGLLCVCKPTGLPTHATGRYMLNSLTSWLEYVMAPKRVRAWLMDRDPLLQSLVCTAGLSDAEVHELYAYYAVSRQTDTRMQSGGEGGDGETEWEDVHPAKAPRPCHRLDKVTSGVLLIAVRQDAAKRIGDALMQKAKEVDAAVTAELAQSRTAPDGGDLRFTAQESKTSSSSGSAVVDARSLLAAPSLQRIVSSSYDLQKFYVARVVGTLPLEKRVDTAGSLACLWPLSGSEACVQAHNNAVQGLLDSVSGRVRATGSAAVPTCYFPGGLLTTAPITAHRFSFAAGKDTHAASSAATLCQTLSTTTNTSLAVQAPLPLPLPAVESVVLCTPYTGRLHQIRYHLSYLGCPIVGDVVYTPHVDNGDDSGGGGAKEKARAAEDATTGTQSPLAATGDAASSSMWVRNERDYIYFDPAQLPAAYLEFCKSKDQQEGGGATTPKTTPLAGVKRGRGEAGVAPSAWNAEVSCYECAGRLPIVAKKECATGTSAVCLHAWAYEMKESMLLLPQQNTSGGEEGTSAGSHAGEPTAPDSRTTSKSAGGVQAVSGGFVRFQVPLPAWALPRR